MGHRSMSADITPPAPPPRDPKHKHHLMSAVRGGGRPVSYSFEHLRSAAGDRPLLPRVTSHVTGHSLQLGQHSTSWPCLPGGLNTLTSISASSLRIPDLLKLLTAPQYTVTQRPPASTMLWLSMCLGAGGRCITRQLPGSPLGQQPALRVSGPRPVWRTPGVTSLSPVASVRGWVSVMASVRPRKTICPATQRGQDSGQANAAQPL